jgi:NAD(P)-dependent dehydrogenase (short-subunit alcohol dehydrogenase family)
MSAPQVALVTGASSGFGLLTARLLAENGFTVFGTSRQKMPDVASVAMRQLDVTIPESIDGCVQEILAACGRIDLLVNNAGQTHASPIEETPLADARQVFETNFWGVVRLTNAVLPTMRARRSGRIINVSSLAGLIGAPGQGFYAASKHALEGYTETLRVEVASFNVTVSLVEPGFFRTNLHRTMLQAAADIPDYDHTRVAVQRAISAAIDSGGEPRRVAELILAIAQARRPRLRYRVGADARWVPRLRQLLPESWFFAGLRRRFGLP